jgi:hypothetical protein
MNEEVGYKIGCLNPEETFRKWQLLLFHLSFPSHFVMQQIYNMCPFVKHSKSHKYCKHKNININ